MRDKLLHFDLIPTSYVLPNDYNLFYQDYCKNPSIWIIKPRGQSQGAGIFLIDKLSQLKKWSSKKKNSNNPPITRTTYVISRFYFFFQNTCTFNLV